MHRIRALAVVSLVVGGLVAAMADPAAAVGDDDRVRDPSAVRQANGVRLRWTNPDVNDLAGVKICRRAGRSIPNDSTCAGSTVITALEPGNPGDNDEFLDTSVVTSETGDPNVYTYGFFATDGGSEFSDRRRATTQATLSITDAAVDEGDAGTTNLTFNVNLQRTVSDDSEVTVRFSTADGTATVANNDYDPASSVQVTFAPGVTVQPIGIEVNPDTTGELDEFMFVNLHTPSDNAWVGDTQGRGTINDDDGEATDPRILAGTDTGPKGKVRRFDVNGGLLGSELKPFGKSYRGTRVAMGDVTGDGVDELIAASGPGGRPQVKVLRNNGDVICNFRPYADAVNGGVFVAAGNFDGDGRDEIVTGIGGTSGPHVRLFDDNCAAIGGGFFAYASSTRFGVTVGAADFDPGTPGDEIVVGPAEASTTDGIVRILRGNGTVFTNSVNPYPGFRGGIRVAGANLDADAAAEIVTAPGPGGGPHVRTFQPDGAAIGGGFFAYASSFSGGVWVAAGDLDGDGVAEIITGPGNNSIPLVRKWSAAGNPVGEFEAFSSSFRGGVTVAYGQQ